MKVINKPKEDEKPIKIHFKGESLEGKKIVSFENLSIGYSLDKILINGINGIVFGKDRLAIMGDNGTGKTTLIKLILGKESPLKGNIALARNITVGYLSQEVIANINNTLY